MCLQLQAFDTQQALIAAVIIALLLSHQPLQEMIGSLREPFLRSARDTKFSANK